MHPETFSPTEGNATAANRKAVKSNRHIRWWVRTRWLSTISISHLLEPASRGSAHHSSRRTMTATAGRQRLCHNRKCQLSCPTMNGLSICLGLVSLLVPACAQTAVLSQEVESVYPDVSAFYCDLHQNPELSAHETQTAAKLAAHLRSLGYEVTEHVGGTGVVALLRNGSGPTVMLRTELDALPVEEKTGLPYASKMR